LATTTIEISIDITSPSCYITPPIINNKLHLLFKKETHKKDIEDIYELTHITNEIFDSSEEKEIRIEINESIIHHTLLNIKK